MAATQVFPPYPIFTDNDGSPLDGGYIYIGETNQNPETNSVSVYWDSAFAAPAAMPIRTVNGYPSNNGVPAIPYVNGQYSMTVRNSKKELVIYSPYNHGVEPSTANGAAVPYYFTGDGTTTDFTLGEVPASKNHLWVFASGGWQERSSYTLTGATIQFSEPIPGGVTVEATVLRPPSVTAATDASSVTYTPSGAGAVERTVQATLRDQYPTLEDFGGGTAVADNSTAMQAAMTAGGRLYIPEGRVYELAAAVTRTGELSLIGGGTLRWTSGAATTGLTVSLTTANNYGDEVRIGPVTFETQKRGVGTALTIDGTAQISGGSLQKRTYRRVFLLGAKFRGSVDPGTDGWLKHVVLDGVSEAYFSHVYVTGSLNGAAGEADILSESAFDIDDQGAAAAIRFENCGVSFVDKGIFFDGAEGINVTQSKFVGVNYGVHGINSATPFAPWFSFESSHIESREYGILLNGHAQIFINNSLIWQRASGVTTWNGVELNACKDITVADNKFLGRFSATSNNSRAVVLGSTTSRATVEGNLFRDCTSGGSALGSADDIFFTNNHAVKDDAGAQDPILYVSSATGRVVIDGEIRGGATTSNITAASGTLVDVDMGDVHLGQKFDVAGQVEYLKGATGGATITQIIKQAGTATIAFHYDAASLQERRVQDAGVTDIHNLSGPLTITAAGTLTLRMQFTSAGSSATITSGRAQLSIHQIGTSGRLA